MQPQLTPTLRKKIDELVELDNQRRAENAKKYPNGLTYDSDDIIDRILNRQKSPILTLLEQLSREDLVYVTALMWWGRGDGVAEEGATFESVLDYASSRFGEMTAIYVYEKPLGRYLPRGLARLGIS